MHEPEPRRVSGIKCGTELAARPCLFFLFHSLCMLLRAYKRSEGLEIIDRKIVK